MHSGFSAMIVAIVALACLVVPVPCAAADDSLSKFRVGYTTVEIVLTGSLGERRPIDVEILYPARKANFEAAPSATYQSRLHGVTPLDPLDPTRWDPLTWQVTSTVARAGVEIAKNTRGFPVVIFSHGSVNGPIDYYPTLEALAANGFVVAAPGTRATTRTTRG